MLVKSREIHILNGKYSIFFKRTKYTNLDQTFSICHLEEEKKYPHHYEKRKSTF